MTNLSVSAISWKTRFFLIVLAFFVSISIAIFQDSPGYMDADYYFGGGLQLIEGNGFTEPYIWNYLDNSTNLPHPSHAYWMPLASIVSAGGMLLTGVKTWFAGRIGFILIALIIPVITAELAFSFTKRVDLAIVSGLLAIFSGYYAANINTSDTFGIYILLGGIFFLTSHRDIKNKFFLLGLISGLFHFTRADGIIWLFITFLIILMDYKEKRLIPYHMFKSIVFCLSGYILIMGPWFIRNLSVFDSLLGPGSIKMLWLTHYDQLFSFPPDIAFNFWLNEGLEKIIAVRFSSLFYNLQNVLAVQGSIFLLPLMIIGCWKSRHDRRITILMISLVGYLILMSIVFPFAGMRGGYFHAGASMQSVLWALAPIGLASLIETFGKRRNWDFKKAENFFLISTVLFAIIFTGYITVNKLFDLENNQNTWSYEFNLYQSIEKIIDPEEISTKTVIVNNPPGFFLATGNQAVAIPDGNVENLLLVANEFSADYLILEPGGFPQGLISLYQVSFLEPHFTLIGEIMDARVYEIYLGK